jgi:hypothetical protein
MDNGRRVDKLEADCGDLAMSTARYSASWQHPGQPGTECGVSADASGVGVWSKWGPSPHQEDGRQLSWMEWDESPGLGLSPGGPADLMDRIDELAAALGLRKRRRSRPPHRRADLETAEPTAEEQRRLRLLRSLGPEPPC